jgi:hypothetical protein
MKQFYLFTILSLLTACTTQPPQATFTPKVTVTLPPTKQPIANAPPGATGKDEQGNCIKETPAGTFLFEPGVNDWGRNVTPESISVIDFNEANALPITVLISDDVEGGDKLKSFTHKDQTEGPRVGITLTGVVLPKLYELYYGTNPSSIPSEFKLSLVNGEIPNGATPIKIVTADGKEHIFIPGSEKGLTVFIRGWDEMDPTEANGVSQWTDPYGTDFRSVLSWNEETDTPRSEVAFRGSFDSLSDEQKRQIILYHLARILDGLGVAN